MYTLSPLNFLPLIYLRSPFSPVLLSARHSQSLSSPPSYFPVLMSSPSVTEPVTCPIFCAPLSWFEFRPVNRLPSSCLYYLSSLFPQFFLPPLVPDPKYNILSASFLDPSDISPVNSLPAMCIQLFSTFRLSPSIPQTHM